MEKLLEGLDRLLGSRRGGTPMEDGGVQYWRRRVLDVAMAVGLGLGVISVIPGVIRAALEGNMVLLVADIGVLVVAGFVLLARGIRYGVRGSLLIAAAFGIGLVQLVTSGIHTPAPLWLFAAPVLAAILFNLWAAMSLIGVVLVTLLGQLVLDRLGLLSPGLAAEVGSPRWVEVATDLVLLGTVVSLFMAVLLQGLRTSFDRVRRVSDELEDERGRLLLLNREMEREIQRRREAEEDRRWMVTAMEQAEDGVAILELDGRIRYVNRSFGRLFDRDPQELPGRSIRELGLAPEDALVDEILGALGRGDVWVGGLDSRRGDVPWRAQASVSTLKDQDGRPSRLLAVVRDVSREAELEAQLQQAQKMQAIGTFAGGIAHDFNNLLVPILGTAELLLEEMDEAGRERLEDITRSARRGKELVAQILAFSRRGDRRRSNVRLAAVVEDSERLLRASLPPNIYLELDLDDDGTVPLSDAEVQQILMNLCTNAFHAMRADGGVLVVSVDGVDGRNVDTRGALAASPPDRDRTYVRLTVADTGEGMPEGTLARVFEPFFTTKRDGEGTGLGLAMVHGVARGVDGTVVIRSAPGRGTRVEVLLPAAAEVEHGSAEPLRLARGADQRVLVVDDEKPVRDVVARFLDRLGYRSDAAGPDDGRRILDSDRPVDLLITDLSMPEINGLELGRIARRSRPGLPMILSTGLVDAGTRLEAEAAGFAQVLPKPFDMAELSAVVDRVLASTARPPP